jgi:amino acid transporter
MMKMMTKQKYLIAFIICIIIFSNQVSAQCSVCTKTAEQLGEGPASALNSAIVYLMMIPLIIMGFIGFYWWKKEKHIMQEEGTAEN